jgi:hypothetical protein
MTTAMAARATRWLGGAALAVTLAALTATVIYTLASMQGRPWDTVEGEILFEADRIRSGLPLYVDAVRGAIDYGPVPARFYVLYPPTWSWLLSHVQVSEVPARTVSLLARAFDATAWFGLLAWIAARADPACRRVAMIAAAFAASVFTLTLFAVTARPDALALLLAGLALERSARKGRIDLPSAAAFALAPWVKPNMLGLAAGAFLADLTVPRTSRPGDAPGATARSWTSLGAALGVTGAMGVLLHLASGGAWLTHLLRSTGQPFSLPLWASQVASRVPFFGAPFAFAAWCGWRARAAPGVRLALAALATSIAWALFSFAKIGSATNYCLEPAIASVVLLARATVPAVAAASPGIAGLALLQALWSGVASVRSTWEEVLLRFPAERRALDRARGVCGARDGDLILGDETGIELALNGRIIATPFQMTHLARRGLYPLGDWIADVRRPEIVGIVVEDDLLERPLSQVSVEHDRFGPELRRVLVDRFELAERNGDWFTYRVRR